MVEYLLQKGADPNLRTRDGNTPAHYAGAVGSRSVLDDLVRAGSNPCVVNNHGYTAFGKLQEAEVQAAARVIQDPRVGNLALVQAVFPDLDEGGAQDLLDSMTEQKPTDWDDNAHFFYAVMQYLRRPPV
eukprot:m.32726 g.32726  ORF g.32726 m.32726 type:complete len:129 (+) comp12752_c0_seq1:478-864(+)